MIQMNKFIKNEERNNKKGWKNSSNIFYGIEDQIKRKNCVFMVAWKLVDIFLHFRQCGFEWNTEPILGHVHKWL